MFVRFVTNLVDRGSHERLGIIRSASFYQDEGDISPQDEEELDELFGWFADFLIVPNRFSRSSKKRHSCYDRSTQKALSWFKDSAHLHIKKARDIAEILKRNNIQTEMFITKTPGYVVYDDEYQVAAVPFSDI